MKDSLSRNTSELNERTGENVLSQYNSKCLLFNRCIYELAFSQSPLQMNKMYELLSK